MSGDFHFLKNLLQFATVESSNIRNCLQFILMRDRTTVSIKYEKSKQNCIFNILSVLVKHFTSNCTEK